MELNSCITCIKGVGEKTAAAFGRLNINTVEQLLHYYPRTYISYDEPVSVSELSSGERYAVSVTINSQGEIKRVRQLTLLTFYAKDFTGTIKLLWFNCPFLRKNFRIGQTYIFVGRVEYKNGMFVMAQPEYYTKEKYETMRSRLQPVYGCTSGITSKTITKAVLAASEAIADIKDYIPDKILNEYNIMGLQAAIRKIHFPEDTATLTGAVKRIAFDEFYSFIAGLSHLKKNNQAEDNIYKASWTPRLTEFLEGLPFKLTEGQMNSLRDIIEDMESPYTMNRLIQGDVGSGKTIVAAAALFACVDAGYQGAIMAPTEVLANQHYGDLKELFEPFGIKVELLTGSMTPKAKREVYERLKNHEIDVLVGTNALIQEKTTYDNLALVVTDEQHRFGVKQREKFALKGGNPHVLVMSATPIPRTLAIIMYGDLDISVIKELPVGRIPIKNCVVGTDYRKTAYRFIASEIQKGHQAYIVCPMVSDSENIEAENVIEYTEELRQIMPPEIKLEYLHGQMPGDEKNRLLQDFYNRKIDILVSTTVIEVGINNPNATVMMVENAERFGLAQLHQLRGRVGRGSDQSFCIFMAGNASKETMERLNILGGSNDGFYVAEQDLQLRGPGDIFGIRQSGELNFALADIYQDAAILKDANEAAGEFPTGCGCKEMTFQL